MVWGKACRRVPVLANFDASGKRLRFGAKFEFGLYLWGISECQTEVDLILEVAELGFEAGVRFGDG